MYERIIKHWPLYGPHLEAAMCKVMRTVLAALCRSCSIPRGLGLMQGEGQQQQQPGSAPNHRRTQSNLPLLQPASVASGLSPRARDAARDLGGGVGSGSVFAMVSPPHGMRGGGATSAGRGGQQQRPLSPSPAPRMVVMVQEAVLLNSLKFLMVTVPSIEDSISRWIGVSVVMGGAVSRTVSAGACAGG